MSWVLSCTSWNWIKAFSSFCALINFWWFILMTDCSIHSKSAIGLYISMTLQELSKQSQKHWNHRLSVMWKLMAQLCWIGLKRIVLSRSFCTVCSRRFHYFDGLVFHCQVLAKSRWLSLEIRLETSNQMKSIYGKWSIWFLFFSFNWTFPQILEFDFFFQFENWNFHSMITIDNVLYSTHRLSDSSIDNVRLMTQSMNVDGKFDIRVSTFGTSSNILVHVEKVGVKSLSRKQKF